MNIFISNINYAVKESQLQELFVSYGTIQSVKIIMDRETGRSRGFGFVEMPDNEEANTAIESLNGTLFQGKNINVSKAISREEKLRRSFANRY